jgi:hypothetical protein
VTGRYGFGWFRFQMTRGCDLACSGFVMASEGGFGWFRFRMTRGCDLACSGFGLLAGMVSAGSGFGRLADVIWIIRVSDDSVIWF